MNKSFLVGNIEHNFFNSIALGSVVLYTRCPNPGIFILSFLALFKNDCILSINCNCLITASFAPPCRVPSRASIPLNILFNGEFPADPITLTADVEAFCSCSACKIKNF